MPADLKSIMRIEVPVIVRIAERTMPVGDVKNLAPGAIIELPKAADDELDVLINNKQIGAGMAVKVGENFGIRITYIGAVKQRIRAMGDAGPGHAPNDRREVEAALAGAE